MLYVTKVLRGFLVDEGGAIDGLEIECLMPNYGSGKVHGAGPSFPIYQNISSLKSFTILLKVQLEI